MKAFITRDTANSIMFGGLERLWIHFTEHKPRFMAVLMNGHADLPFGEHHSSMGYYSKYGWESDRKFGVGKMSVGNWLGYGDKDNENEYLCNWVWNKLCEHFKNAPFDEWPKLESDGVCKLEDFILEVDFKITIKAPKFKLI